MELLKERRLADDLASVIATESKPKSPSLHIIRGPKQAHVFYTKWE